MNARQQAAIGQRQQADVANKMFQPDEPSALEDSVSLNEAVQAQIDRLAKLAEEAGAQEVTSDREKIDLRHQGDWLAGRLVGLRVIPSNDPKEKDQHIAYLNTPDGRQVRFNMGTDLQKKISGEHVDRFIMVLNSGTMDTGHKTGTPMTVFRVWNFGKTLPASVANLYGDDIPA